MTIISKKKKNTPWFNHFDVLKPISVSDHVVTSPESSKNSTVSLILLLEEATAAILLVDAVSALSVSACDMVVVAVLWSVPKLTTFETLLAGQCSQWYLIRINSRVGYSLAFRTILVHSSAE